MIERHYICHTHTDGTIYRVRPNPDAPPDGSSGVVIEYSDDSGKTWDGYLMIDSNAALNVARSIVAIVKSEEPTP